MSPPASRGGATQDPGALRAVSVPLEGPDAGFDPVSVAADGGHLVSGRSLTVAGSGVAATLAFPHGLEDAGALALAVKWLGAVELERRGTGGPGVLAVGAFPFGRGGPCALVVPRVALCRSSDGRAWAVTVENRAGDSGPPPATGGTRAGAGGAGPGAADNRLRPSEPPVSSGPLSQRLRSLEEIPPPKVFAAAVEDAVTDITAGLPGAAKGTLRKVVLARAVDLELAEAPQAAAFLRRLWNDDPSFSPFAVPAGPAGPAGRSRIVGASPELVVSRSGVTVASHAFAGTVGLALDDPEAADAAVASLLASEKDRDEHRWVVEAIAAALDERCASLDVPVAPSAVRLRSDARLGTLIRGTLRAGPDDRHDSALELLARLHPTPAVGGVPRAAALARIAQLEAAARGYWAGTVGWVDGAGDGEWVLAIRSAVLTGTRARAYAGAGIVAASEPDAELAETTVKLRPVLEALCPGSSALL